MCLPKFDIYQGAVAPDCLKNHTNTLDVLFIYSFIYFLNCPISLKYTQTLTICRTPIL